MSAEYREKLTSISFGQARRHEPKVVKDELGNTTTEHWDDSVDVTIAAPHLRIHNSVSEER